MRALELRSRPRASPYVFIPGSVRFRASTARRSPGSPQCARSSCALARGLRPMFSFRDLSASVQARRGAHPVPRSARARAALSPAGFALCFHSGICPLPCKHGADGSRNENALLIAFANIIAPFYREEKYFLRESEKNPSGLSAARSASRMRSASGDGASVDMDHLSRHIGCFARRQIYIGSRELKRLSRTSHGHVLSEHLHFPCGKGSRDQRRPDRAGRHGIHADPTIRQGKGQGTGEGHDPSFTVSMSKNPCNAHK